MQELFTLQKLLNPEDKRSWVKVRILYETQKAVLVELPIGKQWIPKSRIDGVRIKNNNFELHIKESMIS